MRIGKTLGAIGASSRTTWWASFAWGWILPWGGYLLGRAVPNADNYLLLIIIGALCGTDVVAVVRASRADPSHSRAPFP